MQRALGLFAGVLAARRGASGLRLSQEPGAGAGADEIPPEALERTQRQVMYNFKDVQYYSYITIGGQAITGLLDTGSFDLVVFDHSCTDCGKAGKYASRQSKSFRAGKLTQSLYYGSGGVEVEEAFDNVEIGPFSSVNLSFWDGVSASMPVLQNARFQSIIGVGPPETSGSDAWNVVQHDWKQAEADLKQGPDFLDAQTGEGILRGVDLAWELSTQPTLIRAEGITRFSICLGQKSGSVGYFIWNETGFLENPSDYSYIKVLGKHTWTVNMTNIHLSGGHGRNLIGCADGCGAIIDSGTSFLLMPYSAIQNLRKLLLNSDADCHNLRSLPTLTFTLDGKDFSLPPDAYIAKMEGTMMGPAPHVNNQFPSLTADRVQLDIGKGDCQLAVMGSGSYTNWGPLWILGMPFFRKYYTSFETGRNRDERGLYIAAASSNCTPVPLAGTVAMERERVREQQGLRTLNRSNIFIPRIAQKAMTQSFVADL